MQEKIEILQLSVRSTNCLIQEQIYYINDLIVLHELDLSRLPNMGEKSINEIKQQLAKIGFSLGMEACQNTNESLYVKKEAEANIWLDGIADIEFKRAKLSNLLLCAISNLTVRSRNALNSERSLHHNDTEFLKYLFSLQSILILPNIGNTSEVEIQAFLVDIRQEVKRLYQSEKTTINTVLDLMEYMNISQHLIDEYIENNSDNDIHFFAIIDLIIKDNLSKKELKILKYRKDYWNEVQITLKDLGNKLGVTRERIRQIETKADKKLWLIIKGLSTYAHLINFKKQYEICDEFISDIIINKKDKTNFSDNFLYKALSIFLDDYRLIFKSKNKSKFLIENNIDDAFDFMGFIYKIKSLVGKSDSDYSLDCKGFIYPFFKSDSDINIDKIISICEDLLSLEFEIVIDIDNQIIIKGKKKRPVEKFMEEVLNAENQPTHLDDIYNKIKNNYSEFSGSKRYIANAFIGNNKFIYFDRNSTYGLKSWEGELTQNSSLENIVRCNKTDNDRSGIKVWLENDRIIVKGGTIINIVIEYLKQFKEPKHINDIFSEVTKWRETNKSKLVANLKANNRDYFIFYKDGLIGLVNE